MADDEAAPGDGDAGAADAAVDHVGVGRLLAFSDGVFAIAFTLLVLDLTVPAGLSNEALRTELFDQHTHVFSALLSFAVIGRFWVSHHWLMAKVVDVDAVLLALNTALLAAIALVPAAASVLAEYGDLPVATIVYSITIGSAALGQLALWWWAVRRRLVVQGLSARRVAMTTAGLAGAAAGFVVAIPVAFVSNRLAQLCWLFALVPVGPFVAWSQARRRRP